MERRAYKIHVSESIGEVSAEFLVPAAPTCLMTLAHGAGAGMNHSFMIALADALAESGIATLRFNFPFIENKKKMADKPVVAHQVIEAVVLHAGKAYPKLRLYLSGKSFGGRMSSQFLSDRPDSHIKGIVFYGFPLHPAGKPSTDRAEHLKKIDRPMLFLQGSRDALAEIQLIESVTASLPLAKLIIIDKADHGFKAGKLDTPGILAEATRDWIGDISTK